jgi:hypothetical protein
MAHHCPHAGPVFRLVDDPAEPWRANPSWRIADMRYAAMLSACGAKGMRIRT